MEITEVRIKLMTDPNDRLQAFCSITFDGMFVIRDLKIIQGTRGPFVAMPSRKLTDRCSGCGNKNELRARFCNQCGAELKSERAVKDDDGRARLYADIAHPINSMCRELIQAEVLRAFELELVQSRQPGYVCRYDDFGEEGFAPLASTSDVASNTPAQPAATNETRAAMPANSARPGISATAEAAPVDGTQPHHEASRVSHRLDSPKKSAPAGMHQPDRAITKTHAPAGLDDEDDFGAGLE